jgi:hypothetical protein
MNRLKRYWSPTLLGMLLMAILLGVGGPGTSVSAQATGTRQLIIPAAHFYPINQAVAYWNNGHSLLSTDTIPVTFLAPVQFVVPYYATVEKLELMAFDNTNGGRIRVWLYNVKPTILGPSTMAAIDTGVLFQSATKPRTWVDSTITNATVRPAEAAYVQLEIDPAIALEVYGVRVWYHPGF